LWLNALLFHLSTYGRADAALWRDFLQALLDGAGDEVMNSPLGLAVQMAILGRIQGDSNGNGRAGLPSRGWGFPSKRQS